MKRLLSVLLAAALVLSLSACVAEETSITLWHSMSDEAGVLLAGYVEQFNATVGKEKGIVVEAVFQGKYSDAVTKMNSVLNAARYNELPDVMNMDATGKLSYYYSDAAYTVDEALTDDPAYDITQILPAALGNWEFAGARLGLPFAVSTTVLYYNKTLLDKYSLAAPETFADIVAVASALKNEANVTAYAAVPNTPTLANWLGQLGSYLVDHKNGTEAAATTLDCVENGALAAFLTEWKSMYETGALENVDGTTDAFVTGRLALYTSSSSSVSSVLSKVNGAFEVGVAAYPRVNTSASAGATVSGSCLVMFDKGSDAKKRAAWEFVKYMTGAEVQSDFAVGTGYTPANTGAAALECYQNLIAKQPQFAVALNQLTATPPEMRSVTVGPAIDFYYAIQDCVSAMLTENWSVEDAVATMEDELNGLLYQYNLANQ